MVIWSLEYFFQKYQDVIEFHLLTCMVVIAKLWLVKMCVNVNVNVSVSVSVANRYEVTSYMLKTLKI